MTCIAGLVQNGNVYIGGDSAGLDGYDLTIRADEKVFSIGPFIMGFAGSFRIGQLLRYSFTPPPPTRKDLPRYMATKFVNAVRQCLKDGGVARREHEVEEIDGGFLVGVYGRLFFIDPDYQVGESEHPYMAIGCGAQIANGAMFAQAKTMTPKSRVLQALAASERFSAGVRSPFRVVSTEK
jgi:ATP-dependent protease HslVU (ClpYQ) peptidase subunit